MSIDRIAYIGPYGDLFTINPDGSDRVRLTGVRRVRSQPSNPPVPDSPASPDESVDGATYQSVQDLGFEESFAWPTWSPDGDLLAVSRLQITPSRALEVSIQVIDGRTGASRTVFENDVPGLVAEGSPHYLYWSPDGELLSFLATTQQGLTLFTLDPQTSGSATALARGAPLYFSWSGDGQALMVHSRSEIRLLQRPFLHNAPLRLADAAAFRTPALSPDGSRWAWFAGEGAYNAIYVGERTEGQVGDEGASSAPRVAVETGPLAAFMWSPDGRTLAVADNPDPRSRIYQRLRLVSAEGGPARTLVDEPLMAFYWAPNSQSVAWVGVDAEEQVFEMKVSSTTGEPGRDEADVPPARELFRFRPSGEVFTMFSFFDQYAYSHSPWSPDSARLVVAGSERPVEERRNGHGSSGARVYVLDAVGNEPPREIAQGSVAFWSWN